MKRLLALAAAALAHRLRRDPGARRGRSASARLPPRPVARLHLPGRLDRLAVHAQRRDLRGAQQRRLVRFRLFPRHRRVRGRRAQDAHRLSRPHRPGARLMAYLFILVFLVPVAALIWRLVVSKTRAHWIRIGAAAAAMVTDGRRLHRLRQADGLQLQGLARRRRASPPRRRAASISSPGRSARTATAATARSRSSPRSSASSHRRSDRHRPPVRRAAAMSGYRRHVRLPNAGGDRPRCGRTGAGGRSLFVAAIMLASLGLYRAARQPAPGTARLSASR